MLNIDDLLAPFPGDLPQGVDPRRDASPATAFRAMQEARRLARQAERTEEPSAAEHWRAVANDAAAVLMTQGKDMEAAAALTEASARLDGLAGIVAGVKVITGLVERFWGALYPAPDPGEDLASLCLQPLTGLNLVRPILLLPLFPLQDGTPVTLTTFINAMEVDRLDEEQKRRRIADGALSSEGLEEAARLNPVGLTGISALAAEAVAAWHGMEQALEAKAEERKPATHAVREKLAQLAELARRLAPQPAAPVAGPAPEPGAIAGVAVTQVAAVPGGTIASREDALRLLTEVAAWFRRTEPQSPLSYTLDEAVRRGRLSLPDLLGEIVIDYTERARILTALGIRPPPEMTE